MKLLEDVYKKIAENRTEMLSALSGLISIPCVAADAEGSRPFGDDVHKT